MAKVLVAVSIISILALFAAAVFAQDSDGNGIADRFDLPGTQPNPVLPASGTEFSIDQAILASSFELGNCQACHSLGTNNGPFTPWSGGMMANSARDPVFWAQLDVAEADEASNADLQGARDMCLRCHIPKGWLEGRSSGSADALRGMAMRETDLLGVQCEVCHRMVDRVDPAADAVDQIMIDGLKTHPNTELRVPPSYGNGMYIIDRARIRRGPYDADQIGLASLPFVPDDIAWPPTSVAHPVKSSSFQRSGNSCGTCHDVSNPGWPAVTGGVLADKGETQLNFPIERTWTEWSNSSYASMGEDGNCQSCHMNGPLNGVINNGTSTGSVGDPTLHLNDVHVHDFTGGNTWIPKVISEMVTKFQTTRGNDPASDCPALGANPTQAEWDAFLNLCYATVLRELYPAGAFARDATAGSEGTPLGFTSAAYDAASDRSRATLERAADLSGVVSGNDLLLRIWNKSGHKLPTGYPEGRRMWVNLKFFDINDVDGMGSLVAESGEYDASSATLYHDFNLDDAAGSKPYDVTNYTDGGGGALSCGRRTQVYEARLHHTPSGDEFHFILNNERVRDNRIPPIGWNKAMYESNFAEQVIAYPDQMVYHDATTGPPAGVVEPAYNFDEITYQLPPAGCSATPGATSDSVDVSLRYQSVSREYVESLVASNPHTLVYPPGSGSNGFSRADVLEHAWRTFTIDGQTGFPPIEITSLRIALVDDDGDGLPNDWEIANGLDPNNDVGDNGRHGDPDLDGRSNYLEYQRGSEADSPDTLRDPLDLVLVLDFSGSMRDPVPAGSNPKEDALKDAVELFLNTWKPYAIATDRIGMVHFASTVDPGSGLADLSTLAPGALETEIDSLVAATRSLGADGWTAMGGGLQTALNMLQTGGSAGRRQHVILFTNGMQNSSPMVRDTLFGTGEFYIAAEALSSANGVHNDSGVTGGNPSFDTRLDTLGIPVHTIGIGVSETADDRWLNLIQGIASDTGGLNRFVSRGADLEGAFLHGLIESLRGFSPHMIADMSGELSRSEQIETIEFDMDPIASKATFVLSWAGEDVPGNLIFELLTPDGTPAEPLGQFTIGSTHEIGTFYFPLVREDGRPVEHAGTWQMRIGRTPLKPSDRERTLGQTEWNNPVDFRAYLLADLPDFSFNVRFTQPNYDLGDSVVLQVSVLDQSSPVRTLNNVKATIDRPRLGFGTFLSQTDIDRDRVHQMANLFGEALPDLAAAKMRLALLDPDLAKIVQPVTEVVELHDDGDPEHGDLVAFDGIFSTKISELNFPGLVAANVTIQGQSARSISFSRVYTANTVINIGRFTPTNSLVDAKRTGVDAEGRITIQMRVTPVDKFGNYLGPGHRDLVSIKVPGYVAAEPIVDNLDGTYSNTFQIPLSAINAGVEIVVDGSSLYDGQISTLINDPTSGLVKIWIPVLLAIIILLLMIAVIWLLSKRFAS